MSTSQALEDVSKERYRQKAKWGERYTEEHDDNHIDGELALAAACYAISSIFYKDNTSTLESEQILLNTDPGYFQHVWPWDDESLNSKNPRRDLVRAAALIIAEIERLDRKG